MLLIDFFYIQQQVLPCCIPHIKEGFSDKVRTSLSPQETERQSEMTVFSFDDLC